MRGHECIREARMAGFHPEHVWVLVHETKQPEDFNPVADPENLLRYGHQPEIHIYKDCNLARADLRCLFGLTVHLLAQDATQLTRITKFLRRFKPAAVIAFDGRTVTTHHQETHDENIQ